MAGRWRRRLNYWLHGDKRAQQLREEMDAHLEMMAQEFREAGMNESDARDAARRRFGNVAQRQEASRATWIARWLSDLLQDTAFAARTIRQRPGFAAVVVLSSALGIGACSLIFAVANFALLRPLPVADPSRLMSISGKNPARGKLGQSMSYPDLADLRHARSFDGVAAFSPFVPATFSSNGEPERYWGSLVTANYFDVIRPVFAAGRGFDAARDDRPGESPTIVLSYQLWRSRFGGDPAIAGRTIEVGKRKVTVLGVTGPGFRGTEVMFYSDFWLPFSTLGSLSQPGFDTNRLVDRGGQWLLAAGRLREAASPAQAAAEAELIGRRLMADYPATNKDRSFYVERAGQVNPGIRKMVVVFFGLLLGVAGLVLITACANVANLLLARSVSRQKEIATRLAIGAGRLRLVRQLLTESVALALLGGAGGCVLAQLGITALGKSRLPLAMPVDIAISLDYRVLLFSIALAGVTGVIFGLVPALRATRPDLVGALKDGGGPFGRSRRYDLRNILVVAQVGICMVLLICSGLFLRSLDAAGNIGTGMAHRNLLLAGFDPGQNRYSAAETRRLLDIIVERSSAMPGVESVTLTSSLPLSLEGTQNTFTPLGSTDSTAIRADIYSVAPRFFATFGIPFLAGADFRPGVPAADTVIVNQALADKAFPQQSPLGRSIRYFDRTVRITGLVATSKSRSIGEEPHPCLYFPMARDLRGNDSLTGMTLVLRTHGNPSGYAAAVRQTMREIDPALALFDVRTMDAHLSQALFLPRVAAYLFGLPGLMGLLISTIGIYGVISFTVAMRTHEIGVRMALGARRGQVLTMVLKQALLLTLTGSAIGLTVALALGRAAASLLYGVSPRDPLTMVAVPALLLLIALLAGWVPARRAAALDPLRALRYD